jgi:hypothetical protein
MVRRALDTAAEGILGNALRSEELHAARIRLTERRLRKAFAGLEEAERRQDAPVTSQH